MAKHTLKILQSSHHKIFKVWSFSTSCMKRLGHMIYLYRNQPINLFYKSINYFLHKLYICLKWINRNDVLIKSIWFTEHFVICSVPNPTSSKTNTIGHDIITQVATLLRKFHLRLLFS